MLPALEPGSRILVIRHWPPQLLHKGNIVLVKNPAFPQETDVANSTDRTLPSEYLLVKRITHLPGDDFSTERNRKTRRLQLGTSNGKISMGYVFVSSDNPSYQSTTWGMIPFNSVVGVVVTVLKSRSATLTHFGDNTSDQSKHH